MSLAPPPPSPPSPPPPPPKTNSGPSFCTAGDAYSVSILSDAPWGYWRLSDPASSSLVAADCSGYGRNATYSSAGITRAAAGRGPNAPGGGATVSPLFGGTSGYVSLPTIPIASQGGGLLYGYTLEAWVYYDAVPDKYATLFDLSAGIFTDSIVLLFTGTPPAVQLSLLLYASSASADGFSCTLTAPQSNVSVWHHLAVTVQWPVGASSPTYYFALYVDGTSAARTATGSFPALPDVSRPAAYLGKSSLSSSFPYFAGSMAEVAIYGYPLSPGQVQAHYLGKPTACLGGACVPTFLKGAGCIILLQRAASSDVLHHLLSLYSFPLGTTRSWLGGFTRSPPSALSAAPLSASGTAPVPAAFD